jgi:hypothetical protein
MKSITTALVLGVSLLLASGGGGYAQSEPKNSEIFAAMDRQKEGQSVFGFHISSRFMSVEKEFECQEFTDKSHTIFENSLLDWVTHFCKKSDKTLWVQAYGSRLTALQGSYRADRASAELEIKKIVKLLGPPRRITSFNDPPSLLRPLGTSLERLEWEPRDGPDPSPKYLFMVQINHTPMFGPSTDVDQEASYEKDQVEITKRLIDDDGYQQYTSFNRERIWDGIFFLIQWSFYFLVWWFSLKWHVKQLEIEAKEAAQTRGKTILARIKTIWLILVGCAFVSAIAFYVGSEAWEVFVTELGISYAGSSYWGLFVKLLGISLFAWIMAFRLPLFATYRISPTPTP